MQLMTCRRHPSAAPFLRTCSGCAQALFDIEAANRAKAKADADAFARRVRLALGMPHYPLPQATAGETATRLCIWDQRELSTVFVRVGGTVSSRQVMRTYSDGSTDPAREVTVTVDLPGIGQVELFTDWCDDIPSDDLPLTLALMTLAA